VFAPQDDFLSYMWLTNNNFYKVNDKRMGRQLVHSNVPKPMNELQTSWVRSVGGSSCITVLKSMAVRLIRTAGLKYWPTFRS
jgi:hypothetical protein